MYRLFAVASCLLLLSVTQVSAVCKAKHPVVVLPGLLGSVLDYKLNNIPPEVPLRHSWCPRKTDSYSTLWVTLSDLVPGKYGCFIDYMSFMWNETSQQLQDKPGVSVRPRQPFGNASGMEYLDPDDRTVKSLSGIYHPLIQMLRDAGLEEMKSFWIATYDWRHFPAAEWFEQTRRAVETAYASMGGQKVVLVTHSLGCEYAYQFLMAQTRAWRLKYIHEFIPLSPVWAGTPVVTFIMLAEATLGYPPPFSAIADLIRYMESGYYLLPNKWYGAGPESEVLVSTPDRVWTAKNFSDLLTFVSKHPWAAKVIQQSNDIVNAPNWQFVDVPTTFVWSHNSKTIVGAHYPFDHMVGTLSPLPQLGDGDGQVPLSSLSFLYDLWTSQGHSGVTKIVQDKSVSHIYMAQDQLFLDALSNAMCSN